MILMRTELYKVAFKGDTQGLEQLTRDDGEILRGITPQGNSALHVAASRGHSEMVELLNRQKPCLLLMKNIKDETPLHKAAAAGHLEVVLIFLNINQELHCNCGAHETVDSETGSVYVPQLFWRSVNKDRETALHYAARGGHVRVVETIFGRVNGIERIVDKAGESALYTACDHGRLDVARRLLNLSASIADARSDGHTCLHVAIHTQQTDLASLLLHKRPQLAGKADALGNVPLHLATLGGFSDLVRELLRRAPYSSFHMNKDKMAPIHIAAQQGFPEIIEELLNTTPQCVELLGRDNKNALHFALEQAHPFTICRYLLDDKLDAAFLINEPDIDGNTAFHKTAFSKGLRVLKQMTRISKWNLNAVNKDGYTALDNLKTLEILPLAVKGRAQFFKNVVSASPSSKFLQKRQVQLAEPNKVGPGEEKAPNETYSLIAMLLATITFAAGSTVPGGVSDEQGIPLRMHSAAFKAFIISNTFGLSSSMVAIFLLLDIPTLALKGAPFKFSNSYPVVSSDAFLEARTFVVWAFLATMVSYETGVYVLVAPRSLWLAVIVCLIGCSAPLIWVFYNIKYSRTTELLDWSVLHLAPRPSRPILPLSRSD